MSIYSTTVFVLFIMVALYLLSMVEAQGMCCWNKPDGTCGEYTVTGMCHHGG
jgi:hypothetical protein